MDKAQEVAKKEAAPKPGLFEGLLTGFRPSDVEADIELNYVARQQWTTAVDENADLRRQLAEKDAEIERSLNAWLIDETITPDGSVRATLSRTIARADENERKLAEREAVVEKEKSLKEEARAQREWLIKECSRIGVIVNVAIGEKITEAYRLSISAHDAEVRRGERENVLKRFEELADGAEWMNDKHAAAKIRETVAALRSRKEEK